MSDILNCGTAKQEDDLVRFTYQCPEENTLQASQNNCAYLCHMCQENVYYCTNREEAEQHARQGHCIAIDRHLADAVDCQYGNSVSMVRGRVAIRQHDNSDFTVEEKVKQALRPKHSKAWGKDIFDRTKQE